MGWMVVHHVPAALRPGKRTDTNCTGDGVGHKAILNECGESRPSPGFDPRTAQPVASSYTD